MPRSLSDIISQTLFPDDQFMPNDRHVRVNSLLEEISLLDENPYFGRHTEQRISARKLLKHQKASSATYAALGKLAVVDEPKVSPSVNSHQSFVKNRSAISSPGTHLPLKQKKRGRQGKKATPASPVHNLSLYPAAKAYHQRTVHCPAGGAVDRPSQPTRNPSSAIPLVVGPSNIPKPAADYKYSEYWRCASRLPQPAAPTRSRFARSNNTNKSRQKLSRPTATPSRRSSRVPRDRGSPIVRLRPVKQAITISWSPKTPQKIFDIKTRTSSTASEGSTEDLATFDVTVTVKAPESIVSSPKAKSSRRTWSSGSRKLSTGAPSSSSEAQVIGWPVGQLQPDLAMTAATGAISSDSPHTPQSVAKSPKKKTVFGNRIMLAARKLAGKGQ